MPQTPAQRYQADLDSGVVVPDEAQRRAVDALQDLHARLEIRARAKMGFVERSPLISASDNEAFD